MKVIVSMAIDGRLDIPVEIPDGLTGHALLNKSRDEAMAKFADADLTEMEVIGSSAVNVTLPDGRLLDY